MSQAMELTRRRNHTPLLLLLLGFILVFAYIRWGDVVEKKSDGTHRIKSEVKDKANDRVDRLRNKTEFYKLVAASDGYFLCPLCPPETTSRGKFFLYYDEIYKVGISMNPAKRYTKAELAKWNLEYVVLDVGSHSEMEIKETEFMASYALHEDNMKRREERRLVTPPGSGTRLR